MLCYNPPYEGDIPNYPMEDYMKRLIIVLSISLVLLFLAVACNQADSSFNKGSLVELKFNTPSISSLSGDYALMDHEYTQSDYSVYAVYSTGYKENVTSSAKITSKDQYVTISSTGSVTFSGDKNDSHEFTLNASYGGKEVSSTVYAYRPGDAIGGLDIKQTKFFVGSKLSPSIAGIKYITKEGGIHTSYSLPSSGVAMLYNEKENDWDDMITISTLKDMRDLKDGDSTIFYAVYEESEFNIIDIEVVPLSDAKSLRLTYPSPSIDRGDKIDTTNFASTYLKNYLVRIGNDDNYSASTVKGLMYATDESGNSKENFTIKVTVSRKGEDGKYTEVTEGNFERYDVISIEVTFKATESNTIKGALSYSI